MREFGIALFRIFLLPLSHLPLSVHYRLSSVVYFVLAKVMHYRRDDILVNLARSFPLTNCYDLRIICKQYYRHLADIIAEAIWFGGCTNPARLRKSRIMEVVNPEEVQRLYDASPSMMVLYSHCGNWEIYGGIENYTYDGPAPRPFHEDKFCVVYRELHSKFWDGFLRGNRFAPLHDRKNFGGYIESKNLVRYALTHRNEKKIYNVNTDQRPYYGGSGTMEVNFMNQPTNTMSAAASIACKCGMSVSFLKMSSASRGHYKLEYITICDDASKMSPQEIMERYYRLLEDEIREQPWNYIWTHRRWMR